MGRKIVTKKVRKGKTKETERKKKIKAKEVNNNPKLNSEEEEQDSDEDIITILMKKCKMSEDDVLDAHEDFLERMPDGEMSKDDFLLEAEVNQNDSPLLYQL